MNSAFKCMLIYQILINISKVIVKIHRFNNLNQIDTKILNKFKINELSCIFYMNY